MEVSVHRYEFDRRAKEAEHIAAITKSDLLKFWKRLIGDGDGDGDGSGDGGVVEGGVGGRAFCALVEPLQYKDEKVKIGEHTFENVRSFAITISSTISITISITMFQPFQANVVEVPSLSDFKRSLPLYPVLV